ncbi:MAG: Hsp20/alpha crystallin family protein [SAR324 cluster bacterium]|nr:Hsp20/alpha crystallin family protein [SAR324 cluster bacterium]
MTLIRYNPNRLFDTFERFFGDEWPAYTYEGSNQTPGGFTPRVEIVEDGDAVVLNAELPGVEKDSIKVEVRDGVLTLVGEKKDKREQNGNGYFRSELLYGAFHRRFTVPRAVDGEKISAEFKDGVLRVSLPKKPEAQTRQIAVS